MINNGGGAAPAGRAVTVGVMPFTALSTTSSCCCFEVLQEEGSGGAALLPGAACCNHSTMTNGLRCNAMYCTLLESMGHVNERRQNAFHRQEQSSGAMLSK